MKQLLFASVLIALILDTATVLCQQVTIQTDNGKQTVLSRADIEALPHTDVKTSAAGVQSTFVGVSLKALLEKAGVAFGEAIRGKRLASCLLVETADGYRSSSPCLKSTQHLRTSKSCWLTCGTVSLWMTKKGPTGSSYPMKKEWLAG
jgi:hypothetical protein